MATVPSPIASPTASPPPRGSDNGGTGTYANHTPVASRSHHFVSRAEAIKGVSNRFVFSTFYIYLYLGMAILSLTTVILSLRQDCPSLAFYILEIIVNVTMIAEVSIRLVAFGNQFWKSYYNTLDLVITLFCGLTILIIFFSGCSAKGEEVFDTFLLVIRNLFQFGRLALVMRKSGKNVFTRPAPIDLSSASNYSFALDLDLDDEEAMLADRRALGGDSEAISQNKSNSGRIESGGRNALSTGGPPDQQPFLLDSDEED